MQDKRFLGLMDMIDGGGMGRAGSEFEGGPFSGLLNALGIRPQGYADRMEAQQAMPALLPRPAPAPVAPAMNPMRNMSDWELMAMINEAAQSNKFSPITKMTLPPYGFVDSGRR